MQTKKALISVDMMMIIVWLVINTLLDINVNDEKLVKSSSQYFRMAGN